MIAEMTASEWGDWQEYMRLCPFGPRLEATYAGVLASLLHWAHKSEREPDKGPADFFPWLKEFAPGQSPEELARGQHAIAAAVFAGLIEHQQRQQQG